MKDIKLKLPKQPKSASEFVEAATPKPIAPPESGKAGVAGPEANFNPEKRPRRFGKLFTQS